MERELIMSTLPKTWIFDLDGTLLKHNGYKIDGEDTLLAGAKEYLDMLPAEDKVVILTSRTEEYREQTIKGLTELLAKDRKPSGINMAVAVNVDRDEFRIPSIHCEK